NSPHLNQQEREGGSRSRRRRPRSPRKTCSAHPDTGSQRLDSPYQRIEGRFGGARYSELARYRPSLRRSCHQRPLEGNPRRSHRRYRRRPAPNVGSAVLPSRPSTPFVAPDFVALANAFGIRGERITTRAEVTPTIRAARESGETVLLDFRVEQEDSVYPMVAAGASLNDMIRRPHSPLVETASDT